MKHLIFKSYSLILHSRIKKKRGLFFAGMVRYKIRVFFFFFFALFCFVLFCFVLFCFVLFFSSSSSSFFFN